MIVKILIGCVAVVLYFLWMFVVLAPVEKKKRAWCMAQGFEPRMWNKRLHCYDRRNDRWTEVPDLDVNGEVGSAPDSPPHRGR